MRSGLILQPSSSLLQRSSSLLLLLLLGVCSICVPSSSMRIHVACAAPAAFTAPITIHATPAAARSQHREAAYSGRLVSLAPSVAARCVRPGFCLALRQEAVDRAVGMDGIESDEKGQSMQTGPPPPTPHNHTHTHQPTQIYCEQQVPSRVACAYTCQHT